MCKEANFSSNYSFCLHKILFNYRKNEEKDTENRVFDCDKKWLQKGTSAVTSATWIFPLAW